MVACEGERLSAGHHAASSASSPALPSTPRGRAPRAPPARASGSARGPAARRRLAAGSLRPALSQDGRRPGARAAPTAPGSPASPPPPGRAARGGLADAPNLEGAAAGRRRATSWAGSGRPLRGRRSRRALPCAALSAGARPPAPGCEPLRGGRRARVPRGEVRAPAFAPHSGVAGAFSAPPGGLRWRRRRRPRGAPDQHPAEGPERMARRDRLERRRRRKSGSFGALPGICPGDSFFATLDTLSRGGGQRLQLANRTANRPPWFGCGSALRRWQEKQSSACLGLPKECIGADKKAIWQSSGL
ncbi:uncharacterized protein LOC142436490 [Tenrec ecaudatus]|uniref:uncharacterized protein LOC142436490 n=1 Tax=Tenrec ecaudatus TaxID=94439 RepID=UPI003F5A86B9